MTKVGCNATYIWNFIIEISVILSLILIHHANGHPNCNHRHLKAHEVSARNKNSLYYLTYLLSK